MATHKKPPLPEVNFSDYGAVRYLHLGTPWVQGSMHIDKPFDIELEYVQRMMAWMLFVDPDRIAHLHAMQLGLGAAALTKFCHKHLRMKTTAIELNPQVIAACRLWFKLPADTAKLNVVLGDAAEVAKRRCKVAASSHSCATCCRAASKVAKCSSSSVQPAAMA